MSKVVSNRRYDNEEHEAYIREHGDIQPDEDYEMELRVPDRKLLWGKSGGKCSKCKCQIFQKEESDTNIGEECHISSHKADIPSKEFPRYNPKLSKAQRDKSYDNAILLCGKCHKIIDNPKGTKYTIEILRQMKEKHEMEVKMGVENEKKSISATLLLEVEENQNRLHPLFESYNELDKGFESLKKIKLPNVLIFESRIYSASLDKLRLLDTEKGKGLVKYYFKLEYIKEEYKKLEMIHGIDLSKLKYIKTNEAFQKASGRFNYNDKSIIRWNKIESFLICAKKAHDLGEELIAGLKK